MKKLFAILAFALFAAVSYGQSCSATEPCVQLPIANPNNLPSLTVLLSCTGTTCTTGTLQTFTAAQTLTTPCPTVSGTPWKCVSWSQTKTPQNYNDLEPWGTLVYYVVEGTNGEGVLAASPILPFQIPQASQAPAFGAITVVTTGTVGPQ